MSPQNGEVRSADASVYGLFRAAHTWKSGHNFYDDPWLTVGVTTMGIFAAFLMHFRAPLRSRAPRSVHRHWPF